MWEKKNPQFTAGWTANSPDILEISWRILKKLKTNFPYDPVVPLFGICPKDLTFFSAVICSPIFIAALFTIPRK